MIKCLEYYAEATRKGGKKKNTAFEDTKGSPFQRQWLKDYDKKNAGPGSTIYGIVQSYQPDVHDAEGAEVTLKLTEHKQFVKTATAKMKVSGHTSGYEISGVPVADKPYFITARYNNKKTGKVEQGPKQPIKVQVLKPGGKQSVNIDIQL